MFVSSHSTPGVTMAAASRLGQCLRQGSCPFLEHLTRRDGCDKNRLSSIEPGVEGARPLRLRPLPGLNARFTSQALDSVLRWDGAGAGAGAPFFEFVPWHKSDTTTVRAAVATMACPTIRRRSPH